MTKYLITLIIVFFSSVSLKAQWQFQYFVIRASMNHHFFSSQPDTLPGLYANTPNGELQLLPDKSYSEYVPGFNVDMQFHIDFASDKLGMILGLNYSNYGFSSAYTTRTGDFHIIQTNYVHSIGIPFSMKAGFEMFDLMNYFTLGVQYNFNYKNFVIEKSNWLLEPRRLAGLPNQIVQNTVSINAGYNILFFNVQVDYMLNNFLNPEYSVNVGTESAPVIIRPHFGEPKGLFFFRTGITLPISEWSTRRLYFLHRFTRRW